MVPTSPVIMENSREVPVPVDAFSTTAALIASMIEKFGRSVDLEGTELVEVKRTSDAFERDPANSFLTLRRQFRKLVIRSAPYAWMEGENATNTTFGGFSPVPGASGGNVLSLTAMLDQPGGNTARYRARVQQPGLMTLWIAGNLPKSVLPRMQVAVAGQMLAVEPFPVSYYGTDLAWYRAGKFNMVGNETEVLITVPNRVPQAVSIDVVMVADDTFVPRGPNPPTAWLLSALGQERPPVGTGLGANRAP